MKKYVSRVHPFKHFLVVLAVALGFYVFWKLKSIARFVLFHPFLFYLFQLHGLTDLISFPILPLIFEVPVLQIFPFIFDYFLSICYSFPKLFLF